MKELKGTPAQVEWANDIRESFIENAKAFKEKLWSPNAREGAPLSHVLLLCGVKNAGKIYDDYINYLLAHDEAKFWIKMKNLQYGVLYDTVHRVGIRMKKDESELKRGELEDDFLLLYPEYMYKNIRAAEFAKEEEAKETTTDDEVEETKRILADEAELFEQITGEKPTKYYGLNEMYSLPVFLTRARNRKEYISPIQTYKNVLEMIDVIDSRTYLRDRFFLLYCVAMNFGYGTEFGARDYCFFDKFIEVFQKFNALAKGCKGTGQSHNEYLDERGVSGKVELRSNIYAWYEGKRTFVCELIIKLYLHSMSDGYPTILPSISVDTSQIIDGGEFDEHRRPMIDGQIVGEKK